MTGQVKVAYSYFPGCSLHATAREYDASTRAVCGALGIDLRELADWNCCGSTSAHSIDAELAQRLPMRNLEIAAAAGLELLIPCAACYGRSKAAQAAAPAPDASALRSRGIAIHHILDVLVSVDVAAAIRAQVRRPLQGMRAVCYYGCLTVRPPEVTGALDCESPESMDRLLELLGATAVPWSYKTDCCGASLTLSRPDIVVRLVDRLLSMAEEAGAECVVVACSMCHANLDARQGGATGASRRLPVFYISELLGLAMGLPEAPSWWGRHLTDPRQLLAARGLN